MLGSLDAGCPDSGRGLEAIPGEGPRADSLVPGSDLLMDGQFVPNITFVTLVVEAVEMLGAERLTYGRWTHGSADELVIIRTEEGHVAPTVGSTL